MPRSSFLFFCCTHSLLLLQSLIERFSSHLIEFCAVFAISCKVACSFHFTLCEHEPESVGSCPGCWNLSFDKLNWTLSTLFYCFCFPPLNSWSDWFYFVTKSSGMTCNTPNLAFNPQCNSKEIKLSCTKGQFTLRLTLEVFKLGEQMSQIDQECRLLW